MRGSSSGLRHVSKRIRFRQGWRGLLRIGHGQAPQGQAKACPTGIALGHVPTRGSGAKGAPKSSYGKPNAPTVAKVCHPIVDLLIERHLAWSEEHTSELQS